MTNFDFSSIREHNGSKNGGFDELVCQLAHLRKPHDAKRFVSKEGAGGDAGLECYWVLNDGTEIGWQAKYFVQGMGSSQWNQLDDSFATALDKHPHLTKFVVALPLDKTDSRKIGKGGKVVTSIEDSWNNRVEKWSRQASTLGREVSFEYWGAHEITTFLMTDDPLYSGRALYWFNSPVIASEKLRVVARRSIESLGDRYTPQFHVDLPIAKNFDGLCLTNRWWKQFTKRCLEFKKAGETFFHVLRKSQQDIGDSFPIDEVSLEGLESAFRLMVSACLEAASLKNAHEVANDLIEDLELFQKQYQQVRDPLFDQELGQVRNAYFSSSDSLHDLVDYFSQAAFEASTVKAALIQGEAGIGKSHLLADVAKSRLEEGLPTLFLLGQHYSGGKPIALIKQALDLESNSDHEVLGALDAAGEASFGRALIIVDAINEGLHREDWNHHLHGFLTDLTHYPNVAVVLSCRSTFVDYIVPDSINDSHLVRVHHSGFRNYEHRAAEIYLSKQGISKPSSPILAPEFSNPLFLKTCCHSLIQSGLSSFPKGLDGVSSVFDFWVSSVERAIAKRKSYNPMEGLVKAILVSFASKLLPDSLHGLPASDVRGFINAKDPAPNKDSSLFDVLLEEGVLAEDISYDGDKQELVIRFTYERFSDYFVVQQLLDEVKDVRPLFEKGGRILDLYRDTPYYLLAGITEMLAIVIPEVYSLELFELLPDELDISAWQLDEAFLNSAIWRHKDSFTDETLKHLNSLNDIDATLDVLLKLATEPEHPWNADLLHKNLLTIPIAERDSWWSVYLATGYSSEEDSEYESIVRTLIEWSHTAELSLIDDERLRLCSKALLWFLTTPNRKVRDQSTKSLVRLLCERPSLLLGFLDEFVEVNDLYLLERLYATAYGVVCNIDSPSLVTEIAAKVYALIFNVASPVPHLLLRDYARGVLERALYLGVLPPEADENKFRPLYASGKKLENISQDAIDLISGDSFGSQIKNSLMGFPGDFGNYTMSCVHNWSATSSGAAEMLNGLELKKKFAEEQLPEELAKEYIDMLTAEDNSNGMSTAQISEAIRNSTFNLELVGAGDLLRGNEKKVTLKKVTDHLNEDQKEYFRWLSGVSDDRPAQFSRKWAQRWVCKRAYDFGWTEELFESFEKRCSHGRGSQVGSEMERMGKKYQWIAFYELLAHLSDQYRWIDRGYFDVEDDSQYLGPWMINKRNIDPTIWARFTGEFDTYYNETTTWWQPYKFPFPEAPDLKSRVEFLWDESIVPDFTDLLMRKDPDKNPNWLVLRGAWSEHKTYDNSVEDDNPNLDGWFRISAAVIPKGGYEEFLSKNEGELLCSPNVVSVPSSDHEGFLGEYPWHPIYDDLGGWVEPSSSFGGSLDIQHLVPVVDYEWESGSSDYSIDSSLSFYMPSKELINDLGLHRKNGDWGCWYQGDKKVFWDPSVGERGPSYGLIEASAFQHWLDSQGLELIWLIGGEKQLFSVSAHHRYGRLVYSGIYRLEDGKPVGRIWFNRDEPQEQ